MIVKCDMCEESFNKSPSEIKRTKHNFCSKNCTGLFKQRESASKFYSNTEKNGECIEWTGAKNKYGYGIKRHRGSVWLAHRVSYDISVSDPKGMHVCHSCDNPACVNPDHLFLGTVKDNVHDMLKKERGHSKLRFSDVRFIRNSNMTNKELSDKFGICERNVRRIKNEDCWFYA